MDNNKRPGGSMKQLLGESPTRSQLLPLQTNWRAVMTKGYFWPGIVTVVAVLLLFNFMDSSAAYTVTCGCKVPAVVNGQLVLKWANVPVALPMYLIVLALYITGGLAFAAYRIIGKQTPLWVIPVVAAVTAALTGSPMLGIAHILDFGVTDLADKFSPLAIIQGFFAAGLPEETLKAVPVALGVWAARKIQDRGHFLWPLRVAEPLDGILIGIASGLGFTLFETLTQYVPQQIVYAQFNLRSEAMAAQLLIPRVLQNIAGHAAWSGILGYYIGLAGMRPKSAVRLVGVGLGMVSLLHGAWDAGGGTMLLLIVAVATFAMLAGVVMKARELSPNRSQLIRSQVIDGAAPAASTIQPRPKPTPTPASQVGTAGIARSETWGQRSETWDEAPRVEHLDVAGSSIPLTLNARLTETQIPGLKASAGDAVVAVVVANPDDPKILGLKNLSTETWSVETVGRGSRQLSTGRSIRIERGVRIQLGTAQAVIR